MVYKVCGSCKVTKEITQFSKKKQAHSSKCKDCQKQYWKNYYQENKTIHIVNQKERNKKVQAEVEYNLRKIKDSTPCSLCSNYYPWWVMEFDHIRGEKDQKISGMLKDRYSWQKILLEIEKCQLVCRNCHRNKTYQGRAHPLEITKGQRYVRNIKEITPCFDCGELVPFWCSDFDHVRDDKIEAVSYLYGKPLEEIKKELEKCQLVCANCHATRSFIRLRQKYPKDQDTRVSYILNQNQPKYNTVYIKS